MNEDYLNNFINNKFILTNNIKDKILLREIYYLLYEDIKLLKNNFIDFNLIQNKLENLGAIYNSDISGYFNIKLINLIPIEKDYNHYGICPKCDMSFCKHLVEFNKFYICRD